MTNRNREEMNPVDFAGCFFLVIIVLSVIGKALKVIP